MPIHLHPTAPLADRVLLPGDPGRALRLAQALLSEPRMFNHNRGLWGYTGESPDGRPLTIQSTGMGGPSAAIVICELHDLGARTMVRVGTCGGLDPALELGQLLVAEDALGADGTSRSLGAEPRMPASADLRARLRQAALDHGARTDVTVVSSDLFYDLPPGTEEAWREQGAVAVEMEAAALFTLALRRGFAAGAVLTVSDLVHGDHRRIGEAELHAAERRMGELAVAALSG